MTHVRLLSGIVLAGLLASCGGEGGNPVAPGPDPKLSEPSRALLPEMKIADPESWGEQRPTVPEGYAISAIATGLKIPRQTLLLPNGDILVAEGKGGGAPLVAPKDLLAGYFQKKGTA